LTRIVVSALVSATIAAFVSSIEIGGASAATMTSGPIVLENQSVRIEIDRETGAWTAFVDKTDGRNLIVGSTAESAAPVRGADTRVEKIERASDREALLTIRSGDWRCFADYHLDANRPVLSRQFTIENAAATSRTLRAARHALPAIRFGEADAAIFPGSLPVGDQPIAKLESGKALQPRSRDPLAYLWSAEGGRAVGCWFYSEDEYSPVNIQRTDSGALISQNQQVAVPLAPRGRAALGTQYVWLAKGTRDEALRSVGAVYDIAGLHAPSHELARLRERTIYCGHPGGTPEQRFIGYGGFQALERYLPTLQKLGVDILWLLPIFEHGDGKRWNLYAPFDHFKISALYGTEGEFASLCRAAQKMGMDTMLDFVPHGPPDFTPLAKEHPEWVCRDEKGKPTYVWGQLAFDNASPEWQDYFRRVAEHYAQQFGVAGARVDVAAGSPPNWATARPSRSTLGGGLGMDRAIREGFLRARKDVVVLPEEYTGCSIFHGVGDLTYDAQLFFLFIALQDRKAAPEEWAGSLQQFLHDQALTMPPGAVKMRWTANHDTVSWTFQKKRTADAYGLARSRALLALCALIEGAPMIYQGEEDPAVYGGRGESSIAYYSRIFQLRRQTQALRSGVADYKAVTASGGVFACLRGTPPECAIVLVSFNPDDARSEVRLPDQLAKVSAWRDLLSDSRFSGGQRITVEMLSHGVRVLAAGSEP
jgi:glycosidase